MCTIYITWSLWPEFPKTYDNDTLHDNGSNEWLRATWPQTKFRQITLQTQNLGEVRHREIAHDVGTCDVFLALLVDAIAKSDCLTSRSFPSRKQAVIPLCPQCQSCCLRKSRDFHQCLATPLLFICQSLRTPATMNGLVHWLLPQYQVFCISQREPSTCHLHFARITHLTIHNLIYESAPRARQIHMGMCGMRMQGMRDDVCVWDEIL